MSRLPSKKAGFVVEPIRYDDGDDWRIIDLRPDGCDCIPVLGRSSFKAVRRGVQSSQRVRIAFERLFKLYDSEKFGTPMRRLAMKSAALELLLALIELPKLPPSSDSLLQSRSYFEVKAIWSSGC